jgi:hypothetical protein
LYKLIKTTQRLADLRLDPDRETNTLPLRCDFSVDGIGGWREETGEPRETVLPPVPHTHWSEYFSHTAVRERSESVVSKINGKELTEKVPPSSEMPA